MKLCITAAGNDLHAATDAAFGRAPWFVLIDTESEAIQSIENTSAQATQGAGIAAAQSMSEHGVDAVLTGRLGPKAKNALEASGIGMYEGLGKSTIAEALEQFRAGKYSGSADSGQQQTQAGTPSPSQPHAGQGRGQGRGGCGCGQGKGQGRRRGQ
jgi:predicted Fe-Mo cluster-binding NifX family protein